MPIKVNGTQMNNIIVNGTKMQKVIVNGTTVFTGELIIIGSGAENGANSALGWRTLNNAGGLYVTNTVTQFYGGGGQSGGQIETTNPLPKGYSKLTITVRGDNGVHLYLNGGYMENTSGTVTRTWSISSTGSNYLKLGLWNNYSPNIWAYVTYLKLHN